MAQTNQIGYELPVQRPRIEGVSPEVVAERLGLLATADEQVNLAYGINPLA
jgi:hypothetical protein